MPRHVAICRFCLIAAVSGGLITPAAAKSEEWHDAQGNTFRGEPAEVLGPLALFRVSRTAGRMVPWHLLTPAECVRFYEAVRALPPRADDWAQAKGEVTQDLRGNVQRVQGDRLVPADLKGRPEPECYILLFASNGTSRSWEMMGDAGPYYGKLQQAYPGLTEALFFGLRHSRTEHANMAISMRMSWLVADLVEEEHMSTVARLAPADFGMVIVNRDGVPLFSSGAENATAVKQTMEKLSGLLELLQPANPLTWNDRACYLRAIQPVVYANGTSPPLLVGDPINAAALR